MTTDNGGGWPRWFVVLALLALSACSNNRGATTLDSLDAVDDRARLGGVVERVAAQKPF